MRGPPRRASGSSRWPRRVRRPRVTTSTPSRPRPGPPCRGARSFIVVHRLDNLRRSGRIGTAASWLGTALSLKPLLCLDVDGRLVLSQRIRTVSKAHAAMVEAVAEFVGDRRASIVVHHVDNHDDADEVGAALTTRLPQIGVAGRERHGPGAVGARRRRCDRCVRDGGRLRRGDDRTGAGTRSSSSTSAGRWVSPGRFRSNVIAPQCSSFACRRRYARVARGTHEVRQADARPVTGGRSFSVTMPGAAATTAGTALVTGIAV